MLSPKISNSPRENDPPEGLAVATLATSRETGDVEFRTGFGRPPMTREELPVAKSWAHFVAGG